MLSIMPYKIQELCSENAFFWTSVVVYCIFSVSETLSRESLNNNHPDTMGVYLLMTNQTFPHTAHRNITALALVVMETLEHDFCCP